MTHRNLTISVDDDHPCVKCAGIYGHAATRGGLCGHCRKITAARRPPVDVHPLDLTADEHDEIHPPEPPAASRPLTTPAEIEAAWAAAVARLSHPSGTATTSNTPTEPTTEEHR